MEYAHKDVYASEGKWSPANGGNWFTRPSNIQVIAGELYPSWYNKSKSQAGTKMTFDKVSKKKATDCTPDGARIEITVQKFTDPISKKDTYTTTDGYDATADDNIHNCSDTKPTIGNITVSTKKGGGPIEVDVAAGKNPLQTVEIKVGSTVIASLPASASGTYKTTYTPTPTGSQTVTVTVTDSDFYTPTKSEDHDFKS
jgi:penicillin-binding protein 1A